jgi:MFS transporter, NNP family, nitrate/nitrite transporter
VSPRVATAGLLLGLAVGWNVSNLGAVAERIAADYGVALGTVGLFTTATFLVHALLQIPAGRVIDARGARRAAFAALAFMMAANAIALVAPEPALAVCARALVGVGTALGFLAGLDYVRRHGGSVFAQGLYGGASLAGGGMALAIIPQLDDQLGWRAPFVSVLVVSAAAAAALAVSSADAERQPRQPAAPGSSVPQAPPPILRDPRLYRLCIVFSASFGLAIVVGNWVVTLLERAGGYRQALAGVVGSLVLLAGIVGRPLGGWLVRRSPARTRPLVSGCFVASAAGTVVLAFSDHLGLTVMAALAVGIASGVPFAASFSAAARVRPEAPAAAIGMVNMAANAAIVVGTPLLGFSFALPGDGRVGFLAVAGLWIVAATAVPVVRELDLA